jgi:hypothetical protein
MFAESLRCCQSVPELVAAIRSWPQLWRQARLDEALAESNRRFDLEHGLAPRPSLSGSVHFHAQDTEVSSSMPCSLHKEPRSV